MTSAPAAQTETFRCDRQAMTLTRAGCARLWQSVQATPPKPFEGRWHCRACPIGAEHAGVAAPQQAANTEAARIALEGVCPRCPPGKPSGGRLIGNHLCVSCYNRSREVARQKNRKGNPPKVVQGRLGDIALLACDPTSPHSSQATGFAQVTGATEAMLTAAKAARGASLIFARPAGLAFLQVAA